MGMAPAHLLYLERWANWGGKRTMNKMIKGSIAGATGVALLMGGFGTFALWNESVATGDTTITSGKLDIVSVGSQVWEDISTGTAVPFTPSTDKIVPGDVIRLRQTLDVAAEGKNLKARLLLEATDFDWTFAANNLDITMTYAGETAGLVRDASNNVVGYGFVFDDATKINALDATTATSEFVVTFTFADVTGTTDQDKLVSVTGAKLNLTQVR